MNKKLGAIALLSLGLLMAGAIGYGMGLAEAEKKAHEAWLAQPAYEWNKVLGSWDVYAIGVDNESVLIVWYNETTWGVGVWMRDDPNFIIEKGSGDTINDWLVILYREVYTHYNNGSDELKTEQWVLLI